VEVLRGQVQTAKDAGITGFIVSWKSTEVNNRRLRSLIDVARAEDFSLAVIYLEVARRAGLPVEVLRRDREDLTEAEGDDGQVVAAQS